MLRLVVKILFLLINFSIYMNLYADDFPFNYERLNVNFNGVTFNKSSILAYGDGSIVLRSTDRGEKWEQIQISHDSLVIKKIINIEEKYYGIMNKNYLILSDDNGKSWFKSDVSDIELLDIAGDEVNICLLSKDKIFKFDNRLKKVDEIEIDSSWHSSEFIILNDEIYLPSDSGRIAVINKKSHNISRIIDFREFGLSSNCNMPDRIIIEDSSLYVRVDTNIVRSTNKGKSWFSIARGLINYRIYNRNVYYAAPENFGQFIAANIALYRLDIFGTKKITDDIMKRYTTFLYPKDICFINQDTVLAVGGDKLIAMSYDGGIKWNLKSNYIIKNSSLTWINDSIGYHYYSKGKIFRTTDGGATFLPQLLTESAVVNFKTPQFEIHDKNGKSFYYAYESILNVKNVMTSDDFGETYSLKYFELQDYRNDDKITYLKKDSVYHIFYPTSVRDWSYTRIYVLDTSFNLKSTYLIDSLWILDVFNKNNNNILGFALNRNYLYKNSNFTSIDADTNRMYHFILSNDYGITWSDYMQMYMKDTIFYELSYFTNSVIVNGAFMPNRFDPSFPSFVYKIDLTEKSYFKMFDDSLFGSDIYINFDNKVYRGGKGFIYFNEDIVENPFNWIEIPFGNYHTTRLWKNDKYLFSYSYDTIANQRYIFKMSLKTPTTVEIPAIETKPYFWSFPPYPQPANNTVKVHIYWDRRFAINNSAFSIYDVFGSKIEGSENISLSATGRWDGELSWNCNNAGDGVYFIHIRYEDFTKIIPVIIRR